MTKLMERLESILGKILVLGFCLFSFLVVNGKSAMGVENEKKDISKGDFPIPPDEPNPTEIPKCRPCGGYSAY